MNDSDQFNAFNNWLVVNNIPCNGETTNVTSKFKSSFPQLWLMGIRLTPSENSPDEIVGRTEIVSGIRIVVGDVGPDSIQIVTRRSG